MNNFEIATLVLLIFSLIIGSFPIGKYISKVFLKEITWIENTQNSLSKLIKVNLNEQMLAKTYLKNVLVFSIISFLFVFLILFFQHLLPLNPQQFSGLSWDLAFNTSVSFMTNTNWQSYSGESTMSYFSQMIALGGQNFLSAAVGLSVLVAFARSFMQNENKHIGNFFDDLLRSTLYILLPISFIFALFLVSEGVVQNYLPYLKITTLSGLEQILPMGPAASQIAIKQLGTNGGGFFGVNSAHPFENPTALSNFFQTLAILILPGAIVIAFGEIVKRKKEAITIFSVMSILLTLGLSVAIYSEYSHNPLLQTSVNLEGKEMRLGVMASTTWTVFTTAASNGSVNAMISSQNPLTGAVAMFNMMLGEIIFGGVGSGLYGMLLFVILTVFIAGLMVGRTPEYLGKKIEAKEVKLVLLAILIPNLAVLIGTALALTNPTALKSLLHSGPHGFSEILYAFTSGANNNGSAFGGLNANIPFYNIGIGIAMCLGRFGVIIPILLIADSLSAKKIIPKSTGTLETSSPLFALLTISVILIVGGLTFFPALSLGPILEHLLMIQGIQF